MRWEACREVRLRRLAVPAVAVVMTTAAMICSSMACSSAAGAQTLELRSGHGVSVEADAGSVTIDGYLPARVGSLSTLAWGSTDQLAASATGTVSQFETGHLAAYGELHAEVGVGPVWPVSIAWVSDAGGGAYRGQPTSGYIRTGLRATRAIDMGGHLWFVAGVGRAGGDGSYGTARGSLGASGQSHGFTGVATADVVQARASYADFTWRAAWSPRTGTALARTSVDVTAGVRAGNAPGSRRDWSEVGATVRLSRWSALTAAYGTSPSDPERAIQAVRATSIGLRLSFGGPNGWSSLPAVSRSAVRAVSAVSGATPGKVSADGKRALTIHMRGNMHGSTRLDIMGDFTGWRALPMQHAADDAWTVRVALQPGTHHLNIRADRGEWQSAPGLPEIQDDFGGHTSVLVVP